MFTEDLGAQGLQCLESVLGGHVSMRLVGDRWALPLFTVAVMVTDPLSCATRYGNRAVLCQCDGCVEAETVIVRVF